VSSYFKLIADIKKNRLKNFSNTKKNTVLLLEQPCCNKDSFFFENKKYLPVFKKSDTSSIASGILSGAYYAWSFEVSRTRGENPGAS
jgi:hypothetical protein